MGSHPIVGMNEAKDLKFDTQTDHGKYCPMLGTLPPD